MHDIMETLTNKELKALISLNRERLKCLHPDTRRAQVIRHNLDQFIDELASRLLNACKSA
tara:strand:+ start:192 stop:371 length:180 start_codon:yes stop_codon:yes gene_type:complete